MEYSGRTTAREHQDDTTWKEFKGSLPQAITQCTVFEVQWSDCPIEVEKEVKRLWRDYDLGNDHYYYSWDMDDEVRDDLSEEPAYPIIAEYLKSKGIKKCLIHWWW